ncbi:hypothetical protein LEP1GSC051_3197 [Leptospira sp. P2653]|nr:hypothetical protein LEP1GSC051_3197 [Leptospira sp. P2653]
MVNSSRFIPETFSRGSVGSVSLSSEKQYIPALEFALLLEPLNLTNLQYL